MRIARPRGVALAFATAAIAACGGDTATTDPAPPPPGTSLQVPRVLGLTSVDGKAIPVYDASYTGADGIWTVGGSATLQGDSILVIRLDNMDGAPNSPVPGGSPFSTTSAGRLSASGIAILQYFNGTADTARVLSNGTVVASLSLDDHGKRDPLGTFVFTQPYTGPALNPMPHVTGITPSQAVEYWPDTTLVITGTSFGAGATVGWTDMVLTPQSATPTQLTIPVPSAWLGSTGRITVSVTNPGPGGGTWYVSYDIIAPRPVLTSISPSTVAAASGDFTMVLQGAQFDSNTVVLWNGVPRKPIAYTPTRILLSVAQADIQTPGTIQVAVSTPAPGGGPFEANQLAVSPGHPHTFAALLTCYCTLPGAEARLVIEDDGVARPQSVAAPDALTAFWFTDASTIYGYQATTGNIDQIGVDATGATVVSRPFQMKQQSPVTRYGLRLFGDGGAVLDLSSGATTTLSNFPVSEAILVSSDGQLVYSLPTTQPQLIAFDVAQGVRVGAVDLLGNPIGVGSMIHFGTDGLAFAAGDGVHLVRASFVR